MRRYRSKIILGALSIAFIISLIQAMSPPIETSAFQTKVANLDPYLEGILKSLQPNDWILVWVDVEARVDKFGDKYLYADPALYGINWIMITFDPDIGQNNVFWVLSEMEVSSIESISTIPWVRNITLIKLGRYEEVSSNPKFAMKGMDYAIRRAAEGNASLEIIVFVGNRTASSVMQKDCSLTDNQKEMILENVTTCINGSVQKQTCRKSSRPKH